MHLDFLRALYEDPPGESGSGYVSVYLDTTPTTAGAATEVGLRWRAARERLAAAGADDATLDAVEQAATRRDHAVKGRVIFARGGTTRLEGTLPWPPRQEIAGLDPLPHVMPWLAQLPACVPHVRVAADKAGGQIVTVSVDGTSENAEKATVEGVSWPVHKVSAGGWSELRVQRAAEETWAENAKRVTEAAVAAAERVHAQFVVVGGDVRERSTVVDLLPPALRETVVIVDREVDPDDAAFDARVRSAEKRRNALEGRALLDELATRLGGRVPGERRAVTGLADTLTALRDGLASDVLLIGEPSWPAEAVWIGPGLADAATERAVLVERGTVAPLPGRAEDALARAVAGTGAELHFIGPGADDFDGGDNSADDFDEDLAGSASAGSRRGEPADQAGDGVAALLRAPAAAL